MLQSTETAVIFRRGGTFSVNMLFLEEKIRKKQQIAILQDNFMGCLCEKEMEARSKQSLKNNYAPLYEQ